MLDFTLMINKGEACLSGHINMSLAQAYQQFSLGLSQSKASLRGARANPRAGYMYMFNVQKQPVLLSGGASLAHKPYLGTRTESHQGGMKSAGGVCTSSSDPGGRGAMRDSVADVLQSTTSLASSSSVVQLGTLPNFVDQWSSITFQ